MRWYRSGVALTATLMIGIGFALLVRGAFETKPIALLLGALFVAVGGGRLFLLRRR